MTQERGDGAHCVNKESFSAVPTDASKGRRRDREPLCSFLSLVCFPPPICRLYACHAVNMCKCLLAVVWQLIFYGFASVRRALNIHWLMKPNYPRLLPFHRGSQSQTVFLRRGVEVLCLAHHDLPAHTPHAATLFIFMYALGFSSHALASRLVIQNS